MGDQVSLRASISPSPIGSRLISTRLSSRIVSFRVRMAFVAGSSSVSSVRRPLHRALSIAISLAVLTAVALYLGLSDPATAGVGEVVFHLVVFGILLAVSVVMGWVVYPILAFMWIGWSSTLPTTMLQLAALQGPRVDADLVARAGGFTRIEVLSGLARLRRAGAAVTATGEHFEIEDDSLLANLTAALSPEVRERLLGALEQARGPADEGP